MIGSLLYRARAWWIIHKLIVYLKDLYAILDQSYLKQLYTILDQTFQIYPKPRVESESFSIFLNQRVNNLHRTRVSSGAHFVRTSGGILSGMATMLPLSSSRIWR